VAATALSPIRTPADLRGLSPLRLSRANLRELRVVANLASDARFSWVVRLSQGRQHSSSLRQCEKELLENLRLGGPILLTSGMDTVSVDAIGQGSSGKEAGHFLRLFVQVHPGE
jgi:hypothetical protein